MFDFSIRIMSEIYINYKPTQINYDLMSKTSICLKCWVRPALFAQRLIVINKRFFVWHHKILEIYSNVELHFIKYLVSKTGQNYDFVLMCQKTLQDLKFSYIETTRPLFRILVLNDMKSKNSLILVFAKFYMKIQYEFTWILENFRSKLL